MFGDSATLSPNLMRLTWIVLNILMGALFVFAAALQYNDPNPFRWGVIYITAAIPCVLAVMGRHNRVLPAAAAVGVVSVAWVVMYLIRGVPTVSPLHMFDEWEMRNQAVVETREMFGLLIVSGWMIALVAAALVLRRRRPASR